MMKRISSFACLAIGAIGWLQAQPPLDLISPVGQSKSQVLSRQRAGGSAFYLKLKADAKKGMPTRKAGMLVQAEELPMQALRQAAGIGQIKKTFFVGRVLRYDERDFDGRSSHFVRGGLDAVL